MNKTGFLAYNVGKMTPHWPGNLKNYTHLQFAVSENSASVQQFRNIAAPINHGSVLSSNQLGIT